MMPRIDGFEVAQRLRKNPQTANTSIIMLTAKALSADKVTGLQSGADDYIIKPFDPIELLARVKGTLRRAKEMRNLSPLTGLPGNIRIQEEIERQVREEQRVRGALLRSRQLQGVQRPEGLRARGPADPVDRAHHPGRGRRATTAREGFVGHVGGDDFVVVVRPEVAEDVAKRICDAFDAARGGVLRARGPRARLRADRGSQGRDAGHPARGASRSASRRARGAPFAHYGEAVAVATEMKQFAKRDAGSSYAIDQRIDLTGPPLARLPRRLSARAGVRILGCRSSFPGRGATPHRR